MVYLGAGTQSSPIAIDDDSEDEVVYQLSSTSSRPQETQYPAGNISDISTQQQQLQYESDLYRRSPSARSWSGDATWPISDRRNDGSNFDSGSNDTPYPAAEMFILDSYAGGKRSMAEFGMAIGESPDDWFPPPTADLDGCTTTKKRKRVGSFTSQDMSAPGPSHARPKSFPSLANRLSQPESKKARKRRRRAERQAIEEARLQNSVWAEGLNSAYSVSDGWSVGDPRDVPFSEVVDGAQPSDIHFTQESPPSPNGSWVSSMAMAAENSFEMKDPDNSSSRWSPLPTQILLPPAQPPPPLPPPPPAPKHTLPPKPPPPPPIGMKPDQDPNSKHGIFHIEKSNKEAGTDMKKRNQHSTYIPNPARTIVMEQLPKTHRNVEFIYKWSRSACGALPVHLFIDPPSAKALVEFATAELARKAWSSPKLGMANLGLKPHQLKGKPREDQIKVWWYRVDGVGAGAGVGEIEEGEIEGDSNAGDTKESTEQQPPQKETKKEKKARLAREREEKRKAKQKKLALQEQQQQQHEQHSPIQLSLPAQENLQSSQMQNYITPSVPFFTSAPSTTSNQLLLSTPLNALAQPFHPITGSYFPEMLASAYTNPTMSLWNQQPSMPAPTSHGRPQANVHNIKPTTRPLNKTAFGASLNKDGHSDNESIASSAAASTSPVLSIREREIAAEVLQRPRGRPHTIVATNSLADVEDDEDEEEEGMDVDAEPPFNTSSASAVAPVQQPAPPPKRAGGLSSLPPKPILAPPAIAAPASRPQKPQSQPQSSTSSSFVPRNKNIPPPSPRYLPRDVPPHKLKPQLHSQLQQQRLNAHLQPQSQSRPPTAPRSAYGQQQKSAMLQNAPTGHTLPTITATTSSSSSSASASASAPARNTPIPSEPRAMRVQVPAPSLAPPVTSTSTAAALSMSQAVRPNMTKEALLARQKELEERIARSKEELAVATAAKTKSEAPRTITPAFVGNAQMSSQAITAPAPSPVKPSMDLGEKQAMEDRLRKKVLQSQKARAAGRLTLSNVQTSAAAELASDSPMLDPALHTPITSMLRTMSTTPTPLSETPTSVPLPDTRDEMLQPRAPATTSSAISVSSMSSHSFSLEDLAVSFITQTIETMKSQPSTSAVPVSVPMSLEGPISPSTQPAALPRPQRQPSNQTKDVKLELAAKRRRLEQHITETKALMAKLMEARTKDEKDRIMKVMKEKSRLFEEESKASALSDDAASVLPLPKKTDFNFNSVSTSVVGSRTNSQSSMIATATTMSYQFQITRWPVSRHDAGVLILSDDDEDEDDGDDDDGAV